MRQRERFQVAIPVFHGKGGEDGTIQGFLKTFHMPFLFSDVAAQAIALNKGFTKDVVRCAGIQTLAYRIMLRNNKKHAQYTSPCVIKPMDAGSSVGVSIAKNEEEYERGIAEAFQCSSSILVEEYIQGLEYTVSIIEERGKIVPLPVIAIYPKTTFFNQESKYRPDLVEEICPAQIDPVLASRLQEIATRIHVLIGARHLTRSDFIVDTEGQIWFLEINTIPGQTLNSLVPKAIRASGRGMGDVLTGWIQDLLRPAQEK